MTRPDDFRTTALRREISRLRRENARLRSDACRTCGGLGAIDGFLLGTIKRCPACNGSGLRGHRC